VVNCEESISHDAAKGVAPIDAVWVSKLGIEKGVPTLLAAENPIHAEMVASGSLHLVALSADNTSIVSQLSHGRALEMKKVII